MSESSGAESPPPSPPWRRTFLSDWLPRAALESLLIVVSLLAALWLNDWNDDRQRDQRIAEARRFLVEEIRANRDTMASDYQHPHHQRLAEALQAYAELPNPTQADRDKVLEAVFHTGVHPASFRDAVWRSVSAGDLLQYMKPREVFALAQVYRRQEDLSDINKAMYALLVTADPDSTDPAVSRRLVQSLRLHMADVVGLEDILEAEYAATLKQMGAGPEPKPARERK